MEPEIFDWRESYTQTTKTEFIYNSDILDQLSAGSNHFNMRNDSNIKALLLEVFEGDPLKGLAFFETAVKN